MGGVKKTADGFEVTHRVIGIVVGLITLLGVCGGFAVASVRAADRIADATPRNEFIDSVGKIRADERQRLRADSAHEAEQDSTYSWYARQTWGLLCEREGNPKTFCSRDITRGVMQAGRPR